MVDRDAIIKACGVKRKVTDKGIEILVNNKKVSTLTDHEGHVRIVYPRGHEYKHTSCWGRKLDESFVMEHLWALARNIIMNERS